VDVFHPAENVSVTIEEMMWEDSGGRNFTNWMSEWTMRRRDGTRVQPQYHATRPDEDSIRLCYAMLKAEASYWSDDSEEEKAAADQQYRESLQRFLVSQFAKDIQSEREEHFSEMFRKWARGILNIEV
jgi:hypothetical protein